MSFLKKKIQRFQEQANQSPLQSPLSSPDAIEILTRSSSYSCPIIKIEFDDIIKTEEDQYQVKIESSIDYTHEDYTHLYNFPITKTETENFVKLEEEYQVKIEENCVEMKTEKTEESKTPKRNRLGPNSRHLSSTKNIAMNYGRAIFSFAKSSLALPYLTPHLKQEGISENEFYSFLKYNKINIQSIHGLRATLLVEDEDDAEMRACKKVFQWIAEVFIKCFSVNWIIHGKVSHKMVYLKYRFKMLRRIQNPEKFTYIKERPIKQKKSKK